MQNQPCASAARIESRIDVGFPAWVFRPSASLVGRLARLYQTMVRMNEVSQGIGQCAGQCTAGRSNDISASRENRCCKAYILSRVPADVCFYPIARSYYTGTLARRFPITEPDSAVGAAHAPHHQPNSARLALGGLAALLAAWR